MLHTKCNKISPKNRGNSTFIPQIYSRLTGKTTTAIGVEKKKLTNGCLFRAQRRHSIILAH